MVDNIERIADHATNIAEASFYYIEGKDIRHHNLDIE
jgi:phosphate transport system protein